MKFSYDEPDDIGKTPQTNDLTDCYTSCAENILLKNCAGFEFNPVTKHCKWFSTSSALQTSTGTNTYRRSSSSHSKALFYFLIPDFHLNYETRE